MANHFNDLLLETLKDIRIRLERVESRVDHIVNEKADKADVRDLKAELKADFKTLGDKVQSHDQRLDRIETGIKTLQWTMTAGLAILGIILAFVRSC